MDSLLNAAAPPRFHDIISSPGSMFTRICNAQKPARLCGWKPRALPCVVECKDRSAQLFKDLDVWDSYHMNPSIRVYSVTSEQSVEANEESGTCSGRHADPNGVAIDYKLCGARQDSAYENHAGSRGVVGNSASNGALSSMHRPLDLSETIAGGPLPTKQNFKTTISLPVIRRNLRPENRESAEQNFCEQVCQHDAVGLLKSSNQ
uniref:Uncharacterized protein n=1 Tax=Salix viminalis TaxID=40686 RepID=A0A6N2LUS6_SALVM